MLLPGARLGMQRMWLQVYAKQWQSLEGFSHPSDTRGGVCQMLSWEVTSYWTATNHQERKTARNSRLQSHRAAPSKLGRSSDRNFSSVTFWKSVPWCCCRDHLVAILVMHAASALASNSQLPLEPLTSERLPPLNSEIGRWGLRRWWQSNCILRAGAESTSEGKALDRSQSCSFLLKYNPLQIQINIWPPPPFPFNDFLSPFPAILLSPFRPTIINVVYSASTNISKIGVGPHISTVNNILPFFV